MSLQYIDSKYASIVASQLNAKKKGRSLWNFRCPFCGDSQKSETKARGYIYEVKGRLNFKCHNCGLGMSFGSFLKAINETLYKEYCYERHVNGASKFSSHKDPKYKKTHKPIFKKIKLVDIGLESVKKLSTKHVAKAYLRNRKIPSQYFDRIFFTDNYKEWAAEYIVKKETLPEDARIVIPFFDRQGQLIGAQGRALAPGAARYVTIKRDDCEKLLFGLERWKKRNLTYILEGPFDSLFLPNALAAAGSDLASVTIFLEDQVTLNKSKVVLIFDNENRNHEILKNMKKAIRHGYNLVIWPDTLNEKDINDIILSGKTKEYILNLITENTYGGFVAKVELGKWSKI